jgi:hypothetical protein
VRYYVHAVDGQIYGPFDVQSLNQWVQEGRIVPTTVLQPETSQMRMAASTVAGIMWATNQTYQAYTPQVIDDGVSELRAAWVCFGVSILLFCLPRGFHIASGIFGIILGLRAYRKGHTMGLLAMLLNLALLALTVIHSFGLIQMPFSTPDLDMRGVPKM